MAGSHNYVFAVLSKNYYRGTIALLKQIINLMAPLLTVSSVTGKCIDRREI